MAGKKRGCSILLWAVLALAPALRDFSAHAGISVNVTTGREVALALGNATVVQLMVLRAMPFARPRRQGDCFFCSHHRLISPLPCPLA